MCSGASDQACIQSCTHLSAPLRSQKCSDISETGRADPSSKPRRRLQLQSHPNLPRLLSQQNLRLHPSHQSQTSIQGRRNLKSFPTARRKSRRSALQKFSPSTHPKSSPEVPQRFCLNGHLRLFQSGHVKGLSPNNVAGDERRGARMARSEERGARSESARAQTTDERRSQPRWIGAQNG